MAREITRIQNELTRLAATKTRLLEQQARPKLPNPAGIRRHAS